MTLIEYKDPNAPTHDTIRTYTGRYVDPLDMTPDDVNIVDIAHALSRLCRFGGHAKGFLSVAQHSVAVANIAEALGKPRHVQLMALLHDASEAYLVDMPRPIKRRMPEYKAIEQKIVHVINKAFGLPEDSGYNYWWNLVHEWDSQRLSYEIDHLRDRAVHDGGGLWPDDAKRKFLWHYCDLTGADPHLLLTA